MIVIVDYGLGNSMSVINMLKRLNQEACISNEIEVIQNANKLILPGVGHFKRGIENLEKSGLDKILNEEVLVKKKPILGICLGMQLMTKHSEEGDTKGLGWVDAETIKFKNSQNKNLKIPHMGWNSVLVTKNNRLFNKDELQRFYFVHSYYVRCKNEQAVLGTTDYITKFTSAFSQNNIYGVQFHPEKSHLFGLKLLENFSKL